MLEDLGCDGYDFQIQTLFEDSRMASEIRELPITFRDRESGESKLVLGGDATLRIPVILAAQEKSGACRGHSRFNTSPVKPDN